MDENLKKQFEGLCSDFGMNVTTAFTIFAKAVVRERKIPFEISQPLQTLQAPKSVEEMSKEELFLTLQEGLESIESETGRPAEEIFNELRGKYKQCTIEEIGKIYFNIKEQRTWHKCT